MKIDIGIRIITRDITLFVSGIPFPSPGSYSGSISAKVTQAYKGQLLHIFGRAP